MSARSSVLVSWSAIWFGAAVLVVTASAASAQQGWRKSAPRTEQAAPAELPTPQQFGTGVHQTVVPPAAFQPLSHTAVYEGNPDTGYITQSSGESRWWTTLDLAPGIEVLSVCVNVFDNDPLAEFFMIFGTYEAGAGATPPTFVEHVTSMTGADAIPGYTALCATPAAPVLIRAVGDIDGAGGAHALFPFVGIIPDLSPDIAWSSTHIFWRRAIKPLDGVADFADVPIGHPQRRFVEALAASGITGGCSVGNYCPNDPVTRGQMAVFLAAALGLFWPF